MLWLSLFAFYVFYALINLEDLFWPEDTLDLISSIIFCPFDAVMAVFSWKLYERERKKNDRD